MYNNLTNLTPLKTGGQKEVYSAEHLIHGKVVFKKIKPNSDGLERTKREIRAALIIDSPYVPKIIAHNCDKNSPQYLFSSGCLLQMFACVSFTRVMSILTTPESVALVLPSVAVTSI